MSLLVFVAQWQVIEIDDTLEMDEMCKDKVIDKGLMKFIVDYCSLWIIAV
jgi:hypothetical protein